MILLNLFKRSLFLAAGAAVVILSSCKPQDTWQTFNASGLRVDVPSAPKDLNTPMPASIASVTDEFKVWQSDASDSVVTISYSSYKGPADVQGAFDGAVNGVKQTLPDFAAQGSPRQIGGHQAIEGASTFTQQGVTHHGYMIAIVDGAKLWQVQVIPTGESSTAVEKVKASLKFE